MCRFGNACANAMLRAMDLAPDASGAFDEGPRVELIEGMIVCMSPMSALHGLVIAELLRRLREAVQQAVSPLVVFAGSTVKLPPHNAPDPDIMIAEPQPAEAWLNVSAARLVVEVSRTTVRKDLQIKRDIYAAAGVPEYWVVDINKAKVYRFANPRDGASRRTISAAERRVAQPDDADAGHRRNRHPVISSLTRRNRCSESASRRPVSNAILLTMPQPFRLGHLAAWSGADTR